jgi:hypothetical protein
MVRTVSRPLIKGVIFDMGDLTCYTANTDGTLCLPQNWMFAHMRQALGIDDNIDILTYIVSLPTREEQLLAHAKIEKVEEDAMNKMIAQEGLAGLMKVFILRPAQEVPEGPWVTYSDLHAE